jgi:hypothetical protein
MSTADPGNRADMVCAFTSGDTGSAELPMKRRGKLVLPPVLVVKGCTGRIFHPLWIL